MKIPDGYTIVPLKPTAWMLACGEGVNEHKPVDKVYYNMIGSAPLIELEMSNNEAMPQELFDSYAVWEKLRIGLRPIHPVDVTFVLDAVVRLIKERQEKENNGG